jgi:hypothetical protein
MSRLECREVTENFKPLMRTASSACENVFGKAENKFVGGRYWGRPILLIIENGKLANMSLDLLVKDFPN